MPLMEWHPRLSVNVKLFDDQHMKLLSMANELYDAMSEGKDNEVLGKILIGLTNYTATHFQDEERMMATHTYPDLVAHKLEHEKLAKQVMDLQQQYKDGQQILTFGVMIFLRDWLVQHIQCEDKKYGGYLNSLGIR